MIIIDGTINLPEFTWQNRHGYSPVSASNQYATDGALFIEQSTVLAGRPIILTSNSEPTALFTQLEAHAAANAGNEFTLSINGTDYNVMWDFSQQAVSGSPDINFADADPDYINNITLRFIEV
ncbi:hypothetical protein [Catenovulum sediminis]|uniref:hypothetical protein n=1 Tax=Catenovulum sediminis TaxID=1740262 RepID=UPI00117C465D|nr:hypothetical protein [Catenovulum sediminis]